jgi:hypothetical protein
MNFDKKAKLDFDRKTKLDFDKKNAQLMVITVLVKQIINSLPMLLYSILLILQAVTE